MAIGQYGCDPPEKLVRLMLSKMAELDPDVEIILVSGDLVSHGYSAELGQPDHYELLKKVIRMLMIDVLLQHFPDKIILPALGNNDIKYHYVAPQKNVSAPDYYPFLYNVTFLDIPANAKIKDKGDIYAPFIKWGSFRYDHSANLSVISFNSLYYNDRTPSNDTLIKWELMDWLSHQLDAAEPGRKFIIFFHIYPGVYFIGYTRFFWESQATIIFNKIIQRNHDKIVLITGAHSHFPDMKVYFETEFSLSQLQLTDVKPEDHIPRYAILITPSISPVFKNNPGFTLLEIGERAPTNITWHFLELWKVMNDPVDHTVLPFNKLNFNDDLGIPLFTPHYVLAFIRSMKTDKLKFFKYLSYKLGFRDSMIMQALAEYVNLKMIDMDDDVRYFCALLNMNRDQYYFCLQEGRKVIRLK